jgi:hypothetical protein
MAVSIALGFKRPRGRRVTGLRRSEALGFGDHDAAQCCFGRPLSVPRFAGDHVLRVDPDFEGTALTRRATPPRLRSCVAACGMMFATAGAAQVAKSYPASRARPLGGRPLHELQRRPHQVRGAVAPCRLELQFHLPGGVVLNALVRQRWPGHAAAQLLQPLAVVFLDPHGRVQAERVDVSAQRLSSRTDVSLRRGTTFGRVALA